MRPILLLAVAASLVATSSVLAQTVPSPPPAETPAAVASPSPSPAKHVRKKKEKAAPAPAASPAAAPDASPAAAASPAPATTAATPASKPTKAEKKAAKAAKEAEVANATPAPGGGPGMVWVNTKSHVYHAEGSHYYGKTKEGKYVSEKDAIAEGDKAADHGKEKKQ